MNTIKKHVTFNLPPLPMVVIASPVPAQMPVPVPVAVPVAVQVAVQVPVQVPKRQIAPTPQKRPVGASFRVEPGNADF